MSLRVLRMVSHVGRPSASLGSFFICVGGIMQVCEVCGKINEESICEDCLEEAWEEEIQELDFEYD